MRRPLRNIVVLVETSEHGTGRPIVFIHGWRLSGAVEAADMEPVFDGVSGWRRIYLDLPGMGKSGPDGAIRDLDGYLKAVVELIGARIPQGGIALAGTSAGAALARGVAHALSDRVQGLMMRVPMLDAQRRLHFGSDDERDAELDREPREPWLPTAFNEEAAEKRARLWQPARDHAARVGFVEPLRDDPARYVLHGDFSARLTIPMLVIAGRQDPRVGYEDAISVIAQYPRATVAVLDRASHVLPTGSREAFDSLVRDWLHRMDEVWI
jgi:pimeloyl-ACP methyl ester carboxylesterase